MITQPLRRSKIHVPSMLLAGVVFLMIGFATLNGGTIAFSRDGGKTGEGTIVGQVTDVSGMPLEGVTVTANDGSSAVSDIGGTFELIGVRQQKRIIVNFSKPGFVSTQAITSLKLMRDPNGSRDVDDNDHEDAGDGGGLKLERATIIQTMLRSVATQTLDTSADGTIAEEGFRVTFPAESLNTSGAVEVTISPVDVSTNELRALPGDFSARAQDGRVGLLETFSLMSVSITQNGQPVNLKPGAEATLELLLPADSQLASGEIVPLWFYSETDARWIEEGAGIVGTSTSDASRLSITGEVSHFTFWGSGRYIPFSDFVCMTGILTDSNGSPTPWAFITAASANHRIQNNTITDSEGRYTVNVVRESIAIVTAYVPLGGAFHSVSVTFPTTTEESGRFGCDPMPTLTVPPPSCVSGDVRDRFENPIAGVRVFSSAGTSSTTNAIGAFCLGAPGGSSVTVHAVGYESITVITPDVEGTCATNSCAIVTIRPPAPSPTPTPTPIPTPTPTPTPEPGLSCLEVVATYEEDGRPAAGTTVRVFDDFSNVLATGITDATGKVCFENLPIDSHIFVHASDGKGQSDGTDGNTGAGGGSCAVSGCVPVAIRLSQGT